MVSALSIIGSDRSLQEHWIKRFVALLVDSLIFYAISFLVTWFIILPKWDVPLLWTFFMPAISGILFFLYAAVMEASSSGATLGKRILNLRAIALEGDMDFGKAAMRNLSKIYGLFLLLDFLVGFVTDGDPKQKWFDRMAGTTVIVTTALSDQEQHIYQTQQSKYAPPPQEPYPPTRHEQAYQYPPPPPTSAPAPQAGPQGTQPQTAELKCPACGGRMAETGAGRLKCIRCGKIQ